MQKLSIGRIVHVRVCDDPNVWRPAIVVDIQETSFTATVFLHPSDSDRAGAAPWTSPSRPSTTPSPDFLIESDTWRWPPRD